MACTAAIVSLVGGAPPTAARTGWEVTNARRAPARASSLSTTGAPHRWLAAYRSIRSSARSASNDGRQMWVAPTAVTPQINDQPLQWNIGRVHRYLLAGDSSNSSATLNALR